MSKIEENDKNHRWLYECAILARKNNIVNSIHLQTQEELSGSTKSYKSLDTVVDVNESVQYSIAFLNSLEPSGMLPHNLLLNVDSPILLLKNLDVPRVCNDTRLIVKNLIPHVIEATILTGCAKDEDVFIPRILMIFTDIPFEFERLQFSVRLAFAISINKAHGHSLKVAGINLASPCFSHGQLYVTCSRVRTEKNLYVHATGGNTKNVVYEAVSR
jgi:ATP-dependent DNA helicase PIF1